MTPAQHQAAKTAAYTRYMRRQARARKANR